MKKIIFTLVWVSILLSGCKKYLDVKPDNKLVVINSLEDLQALLDNFGVMSYNDPSVTEVCADNYFLTDAVFAARKETERNIYLWGTENVFDLRNNAWTEVYKQVYIANLVLQNSTLIKDKIKDKNALNAVRAQALFYRSKSFLNAVSIWAGAYDENTANTELGIPIRLGTDFNEESTRASLADSYNQILNDLKIAVVDLPITPVHLIRPSKAAAYGLLARTYLYMRKYDKALIYADSCLKLNNKLLDYNTLNANDNFPIAALNQEVINESRYTGPGQLAQTRALINPELYTLYQANDLRKVIFFKNSGSNYIFKGYYAGSAFFFNGVATDEMYLTRAESYARVGKDVEALADLNTLRRNRLKKDNYADLTVQSSEELLKQIKIERRRELPFRGLRWMDIKRWNKEGDQIVLARAIGGIVYNLEPNSNKYAIQLPQDIIELTGMQQNPK